MKKVLALALLLTTIQAIALPGIAWKSAKPASVQNLRKEKIALKVLYVGYSPDKPMPANIVYYSTTPAVVARLYKTRMADFKTFLDARFTEVQTVDVSDYSPAMSDKSDVTIMDAGPVKLPADFDRPMILMHAMAPNVGLPIGLKFDWYCQCLDDEALNIRTSHEIFNKPNKVKLTMVTKPTPGSFFNGWEGVKTPKEMPRWMVVKQDLPANEKYPIGMVAHGEGFNDSPDAESISGGVCLKNAEAVSLGRQGNYFMWGFSGSPDYMTDEAKDVFVNTVCYIKKYDHMAPIVKKVQITTRTGIEEQIYRIDKKLYEAAIVSRREGNARMLKLQQELKDKKAKGEDIGRGNEMFLKMPVTNDMESFEDYLKTQAGSELFAKFGTNTALYHKYFRDNYEYFYPFDVYSLQLDTDAQKLKLSNRKVAILDKCIQLLEKNEDAELAQRVLERYTTQKFTTAADWKKWLTANRSKLFYTESGGFKFMVNTFGQPVKNTTASASLAPEKKPAPMEVIKTSKEIFSGATEPTSDDPVAVSAKIEYSKDKTQANLVINAAILKGWHIYAYVSKENPFIPTETIMQLPEGATAAQDWQTSAALPFAGTEGVFVFEGKTTFKMALDLSKVKPDALIKCGLSYQVCDLTKCFPPTEKTVEIRL
jgi:hypothetical protein